MTEEERSVILAGLAELECKICANDLVVGEDHVCDGCLGAIASGKIDKLDARIFDLQNNVQQQAERISALQAMADKRFEDYIYSSADERSKDELRRQAERIRELEAQLNESVIDDQGTTWTRPTADAYRAVCAANNANKILFQESLSAAGQAVDLLEAAGFGQPGASNTLLGMVQDALKRIKELEQVIGRFRSEKPELGDLSFREEIRSEMIKQGLTASERVKTLEDALKASLIEHEGIHEVMMLNPANRGMKEAAILGTLRRALTAKEPA